MVVKINFITIYVVTDVIVGSYVYLFSSSFTPHPPSAYLLHSFPLPPLSLPPLPTSLTPSSPSTYIYIYPSLPSLLPPLPTSLTPSLLPLCLPPSLLPPPSALPLPTSLTPLSSLSPLQVEDLASTQPLTFSESSLEQMIPLQISLMMTSLVVSLLPRLLLHILQNVGERLEDLITCVTVGMVLCIILWDVLYFEKTLVAAISSCSAAVKIG